MKLLLGSAGLYTKELADEMVRLVGKPSSEINVAIINEASKVEFGDMRDWFFDEINRIRDFTGGRIDFIDLQANDIETVRKNIAFADVIYCIGGNTEYLTKVMRETGFDVLLRELLETKVYVGSSASSMVIGKRINILAYRNKFGDKEDYGITDYLGIVDFHIVPHINSDEFSNRTREAVGAILAGVDGVYLLEDTQAVVVEGSAVNIVG